MATRNGIDSKTTTALAPPVPNGWHHIYGKAETGFVILRESDGSQFVWVPTNLITHNGSLGNDAVFSHQFGRRNFESTNISCYMECPHQMLMQFIDQKNSVAKYGGFYVSRYPMSWSTGRSNLSSTNKLKPIVNLSWYDALYIGSEFCDFYNHSVSSHLLFPSEYDSMIQWMIERNLLFHKNARSVHIGEVSEWTQEMHTVKNMAVVRGISSPVSRSNYNKTHRCRNTSFRVALTIH